MKAKLIKKDEHYFLEVEPNTWTPPNRFHSIIANTLDKKEGDVLQLSLKNCQAIELGYDLDELAEEWVFETNGHKWSNNDDTAGDNYGSFKAGFQKALQLMGDKKFSEDDMRMAYARQFDCSFPEFLQSRQQTEWDVEVETIEYGLGNDNDGRPVYETRCLLDADGCLILKRI